MIQLAYDARNNDVDLTKCSSNGNHSHNDTFSPQYPKPTPEGYFMAFGSIMFAFGGASTFPTIQADMKDKSKFKFAAYISMSSMQVIFLLKGNIISFQNTSHLIFIL